MLASFLGVLPILTPPLCAGLLFLAESILTPDSDHVAISELTVGSCLHVM
jgi:hypothetical protein